MSFFATVLLVNALTFPIPPGLDPNTPAPIYDSPDLYGAEPSVIALDYSTIRSKLHSLGFKPITDVKFVGGRWKIKARYGGERRALEVDPDSGLIISDRPDRG